MRIKQGPEWVWESSAKRYRELSTGRFVSQADMVVMRDTYLNIERQAIRQLTTDLFENKITVDAWETGAKQIYKRSYTNLYVASKGGRNAMTQADWGSIGGMLKEQEQYINGFKVDLMNGRYTQSQLGTVTNRAEMYVQSSNEAFSRARERSYNMPALPAHPGDGSSLCIVNCKCYWDIRETNELWRAYWTLTASDNCSTCAERSNAWAPIEFIKSEQTTVQIEHLKQGN